MTIKLLRALTWIRDNIIYSPLLMLGVYITGWYFVPETTFGELLIALFAFYLWGKGLGIWKERERQEHEDDKLSASEAITGFCAWLSQRKQSLTFRKEKKNSREITELIQRFGRENELAAPRSDWADKLKIPRG